MLCGNMRTRLGKREREDLRQKSDLNDRSRPGAYVEQQERRGYDREAFSNRSD